MDKNSLSQKLVSNIFANYCQVNSILHFLVLQLPFTSFLVKASKTKVQKYKSSPENASFAYWNSFAQLQKNRHLYLLSDYPIFSHLCIVVNCKGLMMGKFFCRLFALLINRRVYLQSALYIYWGRRKEGKEDIWKILLAKSLRFKCKF